MILWSFDRCKCDFTIICIRSSSQLKYRKPSRISNTAMEKWGETEGEIATPVLPSNICYFIVTANSKESMVPSSPSQVTWTLEFKFVYTTFKFFKHCRVNLILLRSIVTRQMRVFFLFWRNIPHWARASSFKRLLDRTQRRTTVGRTPLDEWSADRRKV